MNYQTNPRGGKQAQMRIIYVILALAMVIMAVLVALSSTWRRASRDTANTEELTTEAAALEPDKQVMAPHTDDSAESDTASSATDAAVAPDPDTTAISTEPQTDAAAATEPAAPTLPDFIAPVSGGLLKSHSGDTAVFSVTMNDYRTHVGVDIAATVGSDVYAVADGVISEVWEDPMSGTCLSITHDAGAVSIYRNLASVLPDSVTAGASVTSGQVIGSVGETSLLEIADEAHLHYELEIDGKSVNPVDYIAFPNEDTGYEG